MHERVLTYYRRGDNLVKDIDIHVSTDSVSLCAIIACDNKESDTVLMSLSRMAMSLSVSHHHRRIADFPCLCIDDSHTGSPLFMMKGIQRHYNITMLMA